MSVSVDGSNGITFNDGSSQTAAASPYGLKNRIINGAMLISQRNGTTATTITNGSDFFGPDRWKYYRDVGGTFTTTQSSTAPTGHIYSMLTTASTGASPTSAQLNFFQQIVEGLNVADLGWGTANAQTVTLSFWVRSSITGTYAIGISNDGLNRSYVATYTINAANTWEQKSITIVGDTTGTWLTTNGVGIRIYWDLGSGSNYNLTAGTWGGTWGLRTSGSTTWGATTGATFYITGVQLEVGSTATPFERRLYNQELMNCYRYHYRITDDTSDYAGIAVGVIADADDVFGIAHLPQTMRTSPTISISAASHFRITTVFGPDQACNAVQLGYASATAPIIRATGATGGLTAGGARLITFNASTTGWIDFSAEL